MANKSWIKTRLRDPYLLRAHRENYRSRAAFKLLYILEKYPLAKKGNRVLDLGSAPGSWTQVLAKTVGERGLVIGVDLLPISPISGTQFFQGDFREESIQKNLSELCPNGFDAVFSDISPNTTGIHHADVGHSIEMVSLILDQLKFWLKPNGNFVAKVFQGEDFKDLHSKAKTFFSFLKSVKPDASLNESREVYLVGQNYKI